MWLVVQLKKEGMEKGGCFCYAPRLITAFNAKERIKVIYFVIDRLLMRRAVF